MKTSRNLIFPALAAGLGGCILRTALYLTGMDSRNLPIAGHWAQLGLWGLTLCTALFFLWRTRTLQGAGMPVRSPLAAAGCLAAAAAFFLSDFPDTAPNSLYTIEFILRWGAGLSMLAVAFCRLTGRRPLFLFHGTVCLFLILRMISLYRLWSADPQLVDYGFYLGAYVAMMLTGYHFAAFDAGCGSHRSLWFYGLLTVYLCIVSLSGPREPLFLLLCIIWILSNLKMPGPAAEEVQN